MANDKLSYTERFGAVSRGQDFNYDPMELVVVTDPSHPLYDPRVNLPLDELLIASIMEHGIQVPVIVRKNGEKTGRAVMEVIDGRQRVRCAREANKRIAASGSDRPPVTVPAKVKNMDGRSAETVMIIVNEYRQADDPITKALKIQQYIKHRHSEEEARRAFKLTPQAMRAALELLSTAPEVQKAVSRKQIEPVMARDLVKLPEAKQAALVKELVASKTGKTKEGRERVRNEVRQQGSKPATTARPVPAKSIPKACARTEKDFGEVAAKLMVLATRKARRDWAKGALAALAWATGSNTSLRCLDGNEKGAGR